MDHFFWRSLIKPLFEAYNAKTIVEIGSESGLNTRNLLEYCRSVQGFLHSIDPEPQFDVAELSLGNEVFFRFHREVSLNALPRIEDPIDAVLIDGDHNWYTVFHELLLLENHAKKTGKFPLTILHDTGWPYARRDMYSDPERIPPVYRHPFAKKGMVPTTGELQSDTGINPLVNNAIYEHSVKNGVLTAVEDFIAQSSRFLELIELPGLFGLGIIIDREDIDRSPALKKIIDSLVCTVSVRKHMQAIEDERISLVIDCIENSQRIGSLQDQNRLLIDCLEEQRKLTDASQDQNRLLMNSLEERRQFSDSLQKKIIDAQHEAEILTGTLHRMRQSKSWKFTYWLRLLEPKIRTFFLGRKGTTLPVLTVPQCGVSPVPVSKSPLIGCTIVSKNFLAYARVLARSFHVHHPDAPFFVLLVDPLDGDIDPKSEPFAIVPIADLKIPNKEEICFRYGIRELHTAVKPFFLQWIFDTHSPEHLLYFDPDILVCGSLSSVEEALQTHSIVLTPHVLAPIEDGLHPSEMDILRAGVYNLGFIGLAQTMVTRNFLHWWQDRVLEDCTEQPEKSVFFDQRWIDLVPGLFSGVCVLRDPSCNVAYWNLHERRIDVHHGRYMVNGMPLTFYHFSGYEPEHPDILCKYHFNERDFAEHSVLRTLFDQYRALLFEQRYASERAKPYGFQYFDNGVSIPIFIRRHFSSLTRSKRSEYGNPFRTGNGSYWEWLQQPRTKIGSGGCLTNAHDVLRNSTPAILQAFPVLDDRFASWILEHQDGDHFQIPKEFLSSLRSSEQHRNTTFLRRMFLKRNTFRFYRFLVSVSRRIFPSRFFERIRELLSKQDLTASSLRQVSETLKPFGLNVAGYFTSGSGVGQLARMNVSAITASKIPFVLKNIAAPLLSQVHTDLRRYFSSEYPYNTTLIHVNADQIGAFFQREGSAISQVDRMIGYWAWEIETFPKEWVAASKWFDELWVLSRFSASAIAAQVSCPVHVIPPPVLLHDTANHCRSDFGIAEDRYVFLFIFDCRSVTERKNPFAVIDAFLSAFKNQNGVELVIKFSNADHDPILRSRLAKAAAGHKILLIDSFLSLEATHDLIRCCDAYVSLHRSEGFGFTMAEAMYLGKPVIATNYSGNTDFMNSDNSVLIDYKLTSLDRDHHPYRKGQRWADPDIDQAATAMCFLYEDRVLGKRLGAKAAQDIRSTNSPAVIGALMRKRLETSS